MCDKPIFLFTFLFFFFWRFIETIRFDSKNLRNFLFKKKKIYYDRAIVMFHVHGEE